MERETRGMSGEDTVPSQVQEGGTFVKSGLELHIEGPDGHIRFPLYQEKMELELGGSVARLFFQGDRLFLDERELKAGDRFEFGNHVLSVETEEETLATLEGLSDPMLGRIWGVGSRPVQIGRPGKRSNQVSLDHPTVSREHARIVLTRDGFLFQTETDRAPSQLNGDTVAFGKTALLKDGDILQLGELRFRFRSRQKSAPGLRIFSLGPFEVYVGDTKLSGSQWRHQLAAHILARLAFAAGKPVPTERLLEDFWPDEDPEVGRRRLTWNLSMVRGLLRGEAKNDQGWLVRTHHSVQLEEGTYWHDYLELNEVLKRIKDDPVKSSERAMELYRGPYLEDCYLEWAERVRTELEARFTESMRNCLPLLGEHHGLRQAVAAKMIALDPVCQDAYLHLMQAHTAQGRPEEALKVFEQGRKTLKKEMNLEPSIELVREQQRALLMT